MPFRRWGHQAEIYALEIDAELEGEGRPFSEFRPGSAEDVVIRTTRWSRR